jgi:hypothetical protein
MQEAEVEGKLLQAERETVDLKKIGKSDSETANEDSTEELEGPLSTPQVQRSRN